MIEILSMTLPELEQLQGAINQEIKNRRDQEREHIMEEFAALARARGFDLSELIRSRASQTTAHGKVNKKTNHRPAKVKFRHPIQRELTWAGRGKTPRWINEWLREGGVMEALSV